MTPTGVLLVTPIFLWGAGTMSLLVGLSCVALALHKARCGTPFGVTLLSTLIQLSASDAAVALPTSPVDCTRTGPLL